MTKTHRFAVGAVAALAAVVLAAPALADGLSIRFGYSGAGCRTGLSLGAAWNGGGWYGAEWYGRGWYGGPRYYAYSRWSPVIFRDCNPCFVVPSISPRYIEGCEPQPLVIYDQPYGVYGEPYACAPYGFGGLYPRYGYGSYVWRQNGCWPYGYGAYRYPYYRYPSTPLRPEYRYYRNYGPPLRSYGRITGRRDFDDHGISRYRGGHELYRGGRELYRGGRGVYRGGREPYRGGRQLYQGSRERNRSGLERYRSGNQLHRGGVERFRSGRSPSSLGRLGSQRGSRLHSITPRSFGQSRLGMSRSQHGFSRSRPGFSHTQPGGNLRSHSSGRPSRR